MREPVTDIEMSDGRGKCKITFDGNGRYKIIRKRTNHTEEYGRTDLFVPCGEIQETSSSKITYKSLYCTINGETAKSLKKYDVTLNHIHSATSQEYEFIIDDEKLKDKNFSLELYFIESAKIASNWTLQILDGEISNYDINKEIPNHSQTSDLRQDWVFEKLESIQRAGYRIPIVFHPKQQVTLQLLDEIAKSKSVSLTYVGPDDAANLLSTVRKVDPLTELNIRSQKDFDPDKDRSSFQELVNKAHVRVTPNFLQHKDDFSPEQSLIVDTYTVSAWIDQSPDEIHKRYEALKTDGEWILVYPQNDSGFTERLTTEEVNTLMSEANKKFTQAKSTMIGASAGVLFKKRTRTEELPYEQEGSEKQSPKVPEPQKSGITSSTGTPINSWSEYLKAIQHVSGMDKKPGFRLEDTQNFVDHLRGKMSKMISGDVGHNTLLITGPSGWGKTTAVGAALFPKGEYLSNITEESGIDEIILGNIDEILRNIETQEEEKNQKTIFIVDDFHRQKSSTNTSLKQFIERVSLNAQLLIITLDKCESNIPNTEHEVCARPNILLRTEMIKEIVSKNDHNLRYKPHEGVLKAEFETWMKGLGNEAKTLLDSTGGDLRKLQAFVKKMMDEFDNWADQDGDGPEVDPVSIREEIMKGADPMEVFQ